MKKLRMICIGILLIVNCFVYAGTTGKLAGKVTDANTGEPILFANVVLEGTEMGAQSNGKGIYVIINIPPGKYNVLCSGMGYHVQKVTGVEVKLDLTTTQNFKLNKSALSIEGLDVVESKVEMTSKNQTGSSHIMGVSSMEDVVVVDRIEATKLDPYEFVARNGRANEVVGTINDRNWDTEEYGVIVENEYKQVVDTPLSTFSIDVDAASYANTRRFINSNQLPYQGSVRIEEMINYFSYDYPQPDGEDPFSVYTEISDCPWNEEYKLMHIGLQGKKLDLSEAPQSNLVFLLDVSGSMNRPNKLGLVKKAFKLLVDNLKPDDQISIVVYAGAAGLVLPATNGGNKDKILEAIDKLSAGGSTAGGEGIKLAYQTAKENFIEEGNNRVILATDGDFNIGISDTSELVKYIEEERENGIFLTTLGFGTGNFKGDRMEQLADKGNGNYYYIDNILEAKKVFVSEMSGTLFTIAKDVKLQLEFNPVTVLAYRLVGYIETYDLKDVKTMYRGTFRKISHCDLWVVFGQMGFFKQEPIFDNLGGTVKKFILTKMMGMKEDDCLKSAIAEKYNLSKSSVVLKKMEWLGFFDETPVPIEKGAGIDVLTALMLDKMQYEEGERDLLVLHHEFLAELDGKEQRITSTMIDYGIPGGDTSMARTVSLPAAISVHMILEGKIDRTGVLMPKYKEIYEPVLNELDKLGIKINEKYY